MFKTCSVHGSHSNWKFHKRGYVCRFCIQAKKRQKSIERNYNVLIQEFGEDVAQEYREQSKIRRVHINEFRGYGRRRVRGPEFVGLDREILRTIDYLNAIVGKELNNLGWECSECGIHHLHPSFFEVHHLVAQKDGGSDDVANLRLLCPNCHKENHLPEYSFVSS